MGSSHGETEPRKATYCRAGRNIKPPTPLRKNPQKEKYSRRIVIGIAAKSQGNLMVELATPKRTKQSNQGNE